MPDAANAFLFNMWAHVAEGSVAELGVLAGAVAALEATGQLGEAEVQEWHRRIEREAHQKRTADHPESHLTDEKVRLYLEHLVEAVRTIAASDETPPRKPALIIAESGIGALLGIGVLSVDEGQQWLGRAREAIGMPPRFGEPPPESFPPPDSPGL